MSGVGQARIQGQPDGEGRRDDGTDSSRRNKVSGVCRRPSLPCLSPLEPFQEGSDLLWSLRLDRGPEPSVRVADMIDFKHKPGEIDALLKKHGIEYPPCGAWVGKGWIPILDQMFEELKTLGPLPKVDQIKQKFCELRVYLSSATERQYQTVDKWCALADRSCEHCGRAHGLQTPMSGMALCEDCRKEQK